MWVNKDSAFEKREMQKMRGSHFDGKIMFDMMTDKKQLHVSSKCYLHRIFGNEFNFQIHFDYTTLHYTWYEREMQKNERIPL